MENTAVTTGTCKREWTDVASGGTCGTAQTGCTNCDSTDEGGWCMVTDSDWCYCDGFANTCIARQQGTKLAKSTRETDLEARLMKAEAQIAQLLAAATAIKNSDGKSTAAEDRDHDELASAVAPPHDGDGDGDDDDAGSADAVGAASISSKRPKAPGSGGKDEDQEIAWPDEAETDGPGVGLAAAEDGGAGEGDHAMRKPPAAAAVAAATRFLPPHNQRPGQKIKKARVFGRTGRYRAKVREAAAARNCAAATATNATNATAPAPADACTQQCYDTVASKRSTIAEVCKRPSCRGCDFNPPRSAGEDSAGDAKATTPAAANDPSDDPWKGRILDPKIDFHPDLQISAQHLDAITGADSPKYLKAWCAKVAAATKRSGRSVQWYPGCKPAPADYWLWKADINDKATRVVKAFRGIRPGKTWKISFPNVHGSRGHHEHSYLKLAAQNWIVHGGDSESWKPELHHGPAHKFQYCEKGEGAGLGVHPESGAEYKAGEPNRGNRVLMGWKASDGTISLKKNKAGGESAVNLVANNWNAGLPGAVLSEMLVYTIDDMLGMSTVPPGRFLALDAEEIGGKWGGDHLCASKERWGDYMRNELPGGGKDARIFAWLQTVAPEVAKTSERGLPHCLSFCSKAGVTAMESLGPLLNCEVMGDTEIDAIVNTHKAGNTTIDDAKALLFGAAKACCSTARAPSKPAVALVQALTFPCDKKANCFSAKFDDEYHSISLDNDCLRSPSPHGVHEAPMKSCAAYPAGLRQQYIERYETFLAAYPDTKSPFAAAAMAAMAAHVRKYYGPEVVELVFRFFYHPGSAGARKFFPQNFWVAEANKNTPSFADRGARTLYNTFKQCADEGY